MNPFSSPGCSSRRQFLETVGTGLPMLGLAAVMSQNGAMSSVQASESQIGVNPLAPKMPQFAPRAKQMIHIFANGGASHVDTLDHKPSLMKYVGKPLPTENLRTERATGNCYPSHWNFKKYGQSGLEFSDLFQHIGQHADDLCVIRSMHANVPNHEPSLMLLNCGEIFVRPSLGSWLMYGLGTENENLPGFIVLCPGGNPIKGEDNWRSAFLPGIFQGTYIDPRNKKPQEIIQNLRNKNLTTTEQRRLLDLVQQMNVTHKTSHANDPTLEARIQSYELAYRMQTEATDAFDISQEPKWVHDRYGTEKNQWAKYPLMVRRLIERGVRFVQLWQGEGQPWDAHSNIKENHSRLARECDQPIAAMIADLKERGLLDETLVLWAGEFGRTPAVETGMGNTEGRDHNHHGYSVFLAGGGVKGGMAYGATDEFGWKAVENPVHVHDLHATILKLMGFDHERLTYRYAGRDFRLTDVHGTVVDSIIA
jgi:hypothetical protein